MKKGFKFWHLYIILGVLGYACMPYLVWSQYLIRGKLTFGGEWLVPLLVILVLEMIRQISIGIYEAFKH